MLQPFALLALIPGTPLMPRFTSLKHSPHETRRILRERLGRYLPTSLWKAEQSQRGSVLTDESVLKLLLNLDIEFGSDVERARSTYETLRLSHAGAPPFEELVRIGWVRVIWGRLTGMPDSHILQNASDDLREALGPLLQQLHEQQFTIGHEAHQDPALASTIANLNNNPRVLHNLKSSAPEWVAARLWERAPSHLISSDARIRFWFDRWKLLGSPLFVPGDVWDTKAKESFREAVISVLRAESSFVDWDQLRSRMVSRVALASKRPVSEIERNVPAIPSSSLVNRALWLERKEIQRFSLDYHEYSILLDLANLLLQDVEELHQSPVPHPVARALFDIAEARPELLNFITFLKQAPVLLADMLLYPRLSALACLLIARWPSIGGAWDRNITDRDYQTARLVAFTDAVSILGHYLESGEIQSEEVSTLYSWMHSQSSMSHFSPWDLQFDERMFAVMRAEFDRQTDAVLQGIISALASSMPKTGLGSPVFAAAVDIVAVRRLWDAVNPEPFVEVYLQSIRSGDHSLSVSRIDSSGAHALVQLAARTKSERWREFLNPLHVRALLAEATAAGVNPFTVDEKIALQLRAHIRVLSRALVSWEENRTDDLEAAHATSVRSSALAYNDLVTALVAAVKSGALAHIEKGRVAAFAARFDSGIDGHYNRPIAVDIGEALNTLTDDSRERLLRAVLESDEPLMLAKLLTIAPHSTRARIQERLSQLTPAEAATVFSLSEVQARIEELLSVGALDTAASFMEEERGLETLGKVPGRELARFHAQLRLYFLRKDGDAIANATLPEDLAQSERTEASTLLEFYKALGELSKQGGNLAYAEQTFEQLHKHRPDIFAYAVNLLAARTSNLLSGNLFGQLRSMQRVRARQALEEADFSFSRARMFNDKELTIYNHNKALLLLAIGIPERAYDALNSVPNSRTDDRAAAYSAVALSRMGRRQDALGVLDRAEKAMGHTDVLRAARAQIQQGEAFDARANAVSVEDPIPRIKAALLDLAKMDPDRQAAVLFSPPDAFDNLVISHVRSAAASIVGLVPMMRNVTIDKCEDDITALMRELLGARLDQLQWSLSDQSKGGFTEKGNPGERDLALRKGNDVLAVLEAVVCDRPVTQEWSRKELISHFQKLVGYSMCRLFFHLTYSYVEDPAAVLKELKRVAEFEAPNGFKYLRQEEFPLTDSRPAGLAASYQTALGEVKVVFLLLDMSQSAQRGAAKSAARNNPRNKQHK
jgi:hypothetical protein